MYSAAFFARRNEPKPIRKVLFRRGNRVPQFGTGVSQTIAGGALTINAGAKNGGFGMGTALTKLPDGTYASMFTLESIYQAYLGIQAGIPGKPGAPTVATGAAGALTGTYYYVVTYTTNAPDGGETSIGTVSALVSPSSQKVDLTNIPIGAGTTLTRKIYRTTAAGLTSDLKFYLVTQINDNTTTTYTDNTADSALGAASPDPATYIDPNIAMRRVSTFGSGFTTYSQYGQPACYVMNVQLGINSLTEALVWGDVIGDILYLTQSNVSMLPASNNKTVTYFGQKVGSTATSPVRRGTVIYSRLGPLMHGRMFFYGLRWVIFSGGNVTWTPAAGVPANDSEFINVFADIGTGSAANLIVATAANPMANVYKSTFASGTSSRVSTQFNAVTGQQNLFAHDNTINSITNFISTGGPLMLRGLALRGSPTGTELNMTSGGWFVADMDWAGTGTFHISTLSNVKYPTAGFILEGASFYLTVVDGGNNPVTGATVSLKDSTNLEWAGVQTDSNGHITFDKVAQGNSGNAVGVLDWTSTSVVSERGPFRLQVNGQKPVTFKWPRTLDASNSGAGIVLQPIYAVYNLTTGAVNFNGAPEILQI